ncbi:MAG: HIT family protein [Pseudomonadota bacterium]|nr:HIT family protein [Pseudomonadota bacterium]
MTLKQAYDRNNTFGKILRGELPCFKVYEDESVLSFMDLFPQAEGHTLVIPKKGSATNFFDVEPTVLAALIVGTQKVARAVEKALNPDGLRITQFNGAAAGQTIFHIHFHIIPVYEGRPEGLHAAAGRKADPLDLEALAGRIRKALQ